MLVMAWLAKFCRKNESTFIPDSPGRSGHLEGRREVLLEIERRVSPPAPSVDAILGITAIEDSHDD